MSSVVEVGTWLNVARLIGTWMIDDWHLDDWRPADYRVLVRRSRRGVLAEINVLIEVRVIAAPPRNP